MKVELPCVQVHIQDAAMAEELLLQSCCARRQKGARSLSHSIISLYLYKEDAPLPKAQHHSLSGEALPPRVPRPALGGCKLRVLLL